MYIWPESEAKRGANEVVSCLDHFLSTKVPDTVKKLCLFSDGWREQNHNSTVVNYLQSLIHGGRYDEVYHQLPVRGHSFLPCERHFALVEKMKRRKDSADVHRVD